MLDSWTTSVIGDCSHLPARLVGYALDLTISVGSINKQTWLFNEIANYFENNVNVHACMLTKHSNNKLKANKLS